NWKDAIIAAQETDTVVLGRAGRMAMRALRTDRTNALEFDVEGEPMAAFGDAMKLYFGGDMEAGIALGGQVMGRIDAVRPVAEIIAETADECVGVIESLAKQYGRSL
ncbi:MAG TPA: nitronate monooxygenase, partial [Acidimicrobiales bacterium]|nr:nitronate monooxygenase [Acidimicrobiales bacterium]